MTTQPEFQEFPKMARLLRPIIVTEKIDGTNAQIYITPDGEMHVGSRTRWITPENDNYGFAAWCRDHKEELLKLGPGRHFGEWWGNGIQRGYGLPKGDKRLSLFNVTRWCLHGEVPDQIQSGDPTKPPKLQQPLPPCVGLVPVLHWYGCSDITHAADMAIRSLIERGSRAARGFVNPEGVVAFHTASGIGFKRTIENDDQPKSKTK